MILPMKRHNERTHGCPATPQACFCKQSMCIAEVEHVHSAHLLMYKSLSSLRFACVMTSCYLRLHVLLAMVLRAKTHI